MKHIERSLLWAVVLLLLTSAGAQAARQLFQHPHHPVTWTERCDHESEISVSTLRPLDLENNSKTLAALVRSAAIAIGFECPKLERLQYVVRNRETDESLWHGQASLHSDWQLSVQSEPSLSYDYETSDSIYRVAGVELGMSLETARSIMREQFGDEPSYRSRARMLVSRHGNCRQAYRRDLRSASDDNRCMRVWMSNHTVPQVERVMLVHELTHQSGMDIDEALKQRFGQPAAVTPIYEVGRDARRMSWGQRISGQGGNYASSGDDQYELEADIFKSGNTTRIELRLGGSSRNLARSEHDDFNVLDWRTPKF